jgi:hypothetical protein
MASPGVPTRRSPRPRLAICLLLLAFPVVNASARSAEGVAMKRDGTTALLLEPRQLLEHLVPLIPARYPWSNLLRRVFAVDALVYPNCGGRMRILAAIHPPESAGAILDCLGLPSRPPPLDPPRHTHEHSGQAPADW